MWSIIEMWSAFLILLHNLQFYVALGTISMASTTALSVILSERRQFQRDKIFRIRSEINSFYLPFFDLFSKDWNNISSSLDDSWNKWEHVRPFIRDVESATVNSFFENGMNTAQMPTVTQSGTNRDESELGPWRNFHADAWKDFVILDKELRKLEKRAKTDLPASPKPMGTFYNVKIIK